MESTAMPDLSGDGFVLRGAAGGELDTLASALASDPESSPWLGSDAATIARWFHGDGVHAFVIECEGRPAGVITFEEQLDPDYFSASLDIGMLGWCVGRGVGTAALKTLVRWLIDARGHRRFTIDPSVANARAIRAYEKVGFRRVGVMREYERGSDGRWHDGLLMDLLASEFVE